MNARPPVPAAACPARVELCASDRDGHPCLGVLYRAPPAVFA